MSRGGFEPCFVPVNASHAGAPRGVARLVASQAAHLEDLARLPGGTDEEEDERIEINRDRFVADAARFVARCGELGVNWDDIEVLVRDACTLAGVDLTPDDERELIEAWMDPAPGTDGGVTTSRRPCQESEGYC